MAQIRWSRGWHIALTPPVAVLKVRIPNWTGLWCSIRAATSSGALDCLPLSYCSRAVRTTERCQPYWRPRQISLRRSQIAACGMDSPSDTKDKLVAVGAEWMPPSDRTLQVVARGINEQAGRYFHVERETFYGKSPLAWQLALNGKFGYHSLPIPRQYACHQQNPWQV